MYEIAVKKKFRARHALSNYNGAREIPHEHEFACEVIVAGAELDPSGCVADFARVDEALAEALAALADKSIGDAEEFEGKSPSAENISKHIYKEISASIAGIARVTVWEDENHSAAYFETR